MRCSSTALIFLLSFFLFFATQNARSEEVIVAENPSNSFEPEHELELERVDALDPASMSSQDWRFDDLRVVITSFGSSMSFVLRARGRTSGGGKIYCGERSFGLGEDGIFEMEVPYDGQSGRLNLARIESTGKISYLSLYFRFKAAPHENPRKISDALPIVEHNRELDRRSYFSLGTGISAIRFSQSDSRFSDYRSTVWSVKGAFNYFLKPAVWDMGFSGFMNLTTLSSNGTADIRFIGANARLGYIFSSIEKPWRLALYGGWYYSTMVADDLSFGYRNLSGPQIYPTIRRVFSNGTAVSGYFKWSLITDHIGLMNIGNNEVATGLGYLFPVSGRTFILGVDYARLRFGVAGRQIDTSSLSLGLSLAL